MRGRPRRWRCVNIMPRSNMFKPAGIPAAELERVVLTREETEALHLADVECLEQSVAAEKMGVSQPTFSRELTTARRKVADALLNGKAIELGGENMPNRDGTGPEGKGPGTGRGLGGCKGGPNEDQTPVTKADEKPVLLGRGRGRGLGMGRGLGRGQGRQN